MYDIARWMGREGANEFVYLVSFRRKFGQIKVSPTLAAFQSVSESFGLLKQAQSLKLLKLYSCAAG